jgi:hypothetical protein
MRAACIVAIAVTLCAPAAQAQDKRSAPPPMESAPAVSGVGALLPTATFAGLIFGQPVSMDNYYFAKRVAYMYPRPWGAADMPEDQREDVVWESLILHYESFRRGITATEEELNVMADEILRSHEQTFTRRSDPDRYRRWISDNLKQDVELFENQLRYLIQIRQLKERLLQEQQVTATLPEMQQEFLNEQHHVGGEMVTFQDNEDAQRFYDQMKEPGAWDIMKGAGKHPVRPVSMMTIEAYVDLWGVPHEQMMAFHALELGQVGPPMPFGKEWAVYRLLDKRTGDLKDFPGKEEAYRRQVEAKKKFEAQQAAIKALKDKAALKVFVKPDAGLVRDGG